MLKAISSTSILKAGVLIVVFCFAAVLSAKATSESVTYSSPSSGACATGGSGTLTIDASGDVSFQGVTSPGSGCSFSGVYDTAITVGTTTAPAGSAANLAAFASGTYYNNGDTVCSTACNTGQTVGIYISGSTIDLYDNNGGACSTADPFASSCSGGSLISGGSIIVLSLGGSTSTPEPSSLMLLGSGLAVLMGAGLFRKQRSGDLI